MIWSDSPRGLFISAPCAITGMVQLGRRSASQMLCTPTPIPSPYLSLGFLKAWQLGSKSKCFLEKNQLLPVSQSLSPWTGSLISLFYRLRYIYIPCVLEGRVSRVLGSHLSLPHAPSPKQTKASSGLAHPPIPTSQIKPPSAVFNVFSDSHFHFLCLSCSF